MSRPEYDVCFTISSGVANGKRPSKAPKPRWHGSNDPLDIQGVILPAPMTYVGSSRSLNEPSAVNPSLPVAQSTSYEPLGYWPSYSGMSGGQRRAYLNWMSSGRAGMPSEIGYAFVFFYGLERRALHDREDIPAIFDEVNRLRSLHISSAAKPSASFMGYTSSLLWLLLAVSPQLLTEQQVRTLVSTCSRSQDEHIAILIHWCSIHGSFMPGWLAFQIAKRLPESQRGITLRNAESQLQRLLDERYYARLPQGIKVRLDTPGKLKVWPVSHYTASAALESYQHKIRVPAKLTASLPALSKLWNECSEELRELASLLNKTKQTGIPADRALCWEALPASMRRGDHPLRPVLAGVLEPRLARQEFVMVAVSQLAKLANLPDREKYSADQSVRLASIAEYCGYAIEPDVRISGRNYASGETAILFRNLEGDTNAERYNSACLMLRFGLLAASAHDKPDRDQLAMLANHILEVFGLSLPEQKRMKALAALLLHTGVDMAGAREILRKLTTSQCEVIGKLLIALAAHDGVVSAEEMKSLRKCFDRLGLGAAVLDQHLAALCAQDAMMIVQRGKRRSAGEGIPRVPVTVEPASVRLDRAAIDALLRDTHEVQQALAHAMTVEPEAPDYAGGEGETQTTPELTEHTALSSCETLDDRFKPLYHSLIKREMWPIAEATVLAREHGHMLNGALDSINEWSIESYGGPLFYEEGDCLVVEMEILN